MVNSPGGNSVPSSPAGLMSGLTLGSPSAAGSPWGTQKLAPIGTSRPGTMNGTSRFMQARDVQLKKHRNQFLALSESCEIDFKASHMKALSLVPQLKKKQALECEESNQNLEEQVSKQITRIEALRQEYQLSMKEMQRKHVEGQQRRIAGETLDLSPGSPSLQNTLATSASRAATAPSSPSHGAGGSAAFGAAPADDAPASATAPSVPAVAPPAALPMLNVTMPQSPGARAEYSNEFSRLESTHDKFVGRLGRNHEHCLDLRTEECSNWDASKEQCMEAVRTHHSSFTHHLEAKVRELEAFYASQRGRLGAKEGDALGREARLRANLESLIQSSVSKLSALLVEYLGKDMPPSEGALQELNNAHAKHQRTLWAELQAQLEVHEGTLRDLLPTHATAAADVQCGCVAGLDAHDKVLNQVLTDYLTGLATLHTQYDNAEEVHRSNLAAVRSEHLRQLSSTREGYLGEVAGLLEEYRARLAELKQQFLLKHEADLAEA